MKGILVTLACLITLSACMGQEFRDESTFSVDVSQYDRLNLYNRRGAVTVKAISGNQARLTVKRYLKAKSSSRLEEAKEEIYMDKMERNGEIVFFIQHPNVKLQFENDGVAWYNGNNNNGWWDDDRNRIKAEFTITLEMPANEPLTVVNHERPLKVSGMQADLIARNHHDGVLVEKQGGSADVHSHHGDVEVFYTKNPTRACRYDTHHGDIRVHYRNGLAADASLYSYHGDFYSSFDWEMKPVQLTTSNRSNKAKYKVSSKKGTEIAIGNGGYMQKFNTHHGDIYLLNEDSK